MRGKIMLGEKSEIWAIGDVAKYFGVAVRTVRMYYEKGYKVRAGALDFKKLPRYKIGSDWRWFQDEVRAFARNGNVA